VYEIDEACLRLAIPPMLLQPLIENALEHGIGPKLEGGTVTIECRKEGEKIFMAVSDTGMGYSGNLNEMLTKGIGVSNIAKRLRLLFNEPLLISREQTGLRFSFFVPVE
jgi:two-component system, LytTR family, sensor kinase